MAHEVFDYRGHRIAVASFPNGDRFGWEFRIDHENVVSLRVSSAADESGARAEAYAAARNVLDLRKGRDTTSP